MIVLVPSLFVVMVWGGRVEGSSNSSSSAQSGRLRGGVLVIRVVMLWTRYLLCYLGHDGCVVEFVDREIILTEDPKIVRGTF